MSKTVMLRFPEIQPSEAGALVEVIGILSMSDSIERFNDVRKHVEFIKGSPLESYERSLAFEFFDYALQSYVLGLDHATIYHAALSVELALAASLMKVLPYRDLIKEVKSESKVNETQSSDARDLCFLRDCYVHYQNVVFSDLEGFRSNAKVVESLQDITDEDKQDFLRISKNVTELITRRFPVSRESSQYFRRYEKFLRKRSDRYLEWINSIESGKILAAIREYRRTGMRYDRRRYDALDAIVKSFTILSALEAFSKV